MADYADVVPESTLNAWPAVANALPGGGSLMGGTGLAIWLRHRRSVDLDIFFADPLDTDATLSALAAAGEFYPIEVSERLIRGVFNSVNVDIVVEANTNRLGRPIEVGGLPVASLQDITAGKLQAVTGRKQLRDFLDVMFIETEGEIRIEQAVMLNFRRYGVDLHLSEVTRVLRHLEDFDSVGRDPAMEDAFGQDIRDRVEEYFRARRPQLTQTFRQMLAEDS